MKTLYRLTFVLVILAICSFKPGPVKIKPRLCGSTLQVANQATGSQKITRVTHYDSGGTGITTNMNLTSGQSIALGSLQLAWTDITVITNGVFDYLSFKDAFGNEIERQYEDGSNLYVFSVFINCNNYSYTLTMW